MNKNTLTPFFRQILISLSTILLFGAGLMTPLATAQGDVRYITDVLYVPLRSGQGNDYRIINARLKSGSQLTFLEPGETDEWTKVRTASGEEGWIRTQYLSTAEPSKITLQKTLAELAVVKKKNQSLSSENSKLKKINANLNSQANSASQQSESMAAELQSIKTLSANAISLDKNYRELLEKHQLLQTKNDVLTAENEKLKNDNRVNFMLYGIGILLLGVVLAYVIPALKPKKRYADWS